MFVTPNPAIVKERGGTVIIDIQQAYHMLEEDIHKHLASRNLTVQTNDTVLDEVTGFVVGHIVDGFMDYAKTKSVQRKEHYESSLLECAKSMEDIYTSLEAAINGVKVAEDAVLNCILNNVPEIDAMDVDDYYFNPGTSLFITLK